MNKKNLYKIISVIFILAVLIGMLVYMAFKDGLDNIALILKTADYRWTALGLLLMFAEIAADSVVLAIPLKKSGYKIGFFEILKSDYLGRFFNYITPFNSGGQPIQAYFLSKKGALVSGTLSILFIKYIVYQVALLSLGIILFIFNYNYFWEVYGGYVGLIIAGLLVNLIVTFIIIFTGKHPEIVSRLIVSLINLFSKIHIGKRYLIGKPEKINSKVTTGVSNYGKQFKDTSCSFFTLFKMYLVSLLQIFFYLTITYAIYRALGNSSASFFNILTVQIFLFMLIAYIPTPGASLGAEGAFVLFFLNIFGPTTNMANLFWRFFSFYIPFIVGGIVVLTSGSMDKAHFKSE
ncbi:MAG: flippase-like domain-containing protein [Lachnospiraceae bacterium]|nr:flippase-like domain-containing protein [Lachnospiraceae bacterium]